VPKNYKTVTEFVKVMPRILWPLLSWTRCILHVAFCEGELNGDITLSHSAAAAAAAEMRQR